MIAVLRADEARAFDRHASDVAGVSSLILMENAGSGAARSLERRLGPRRVWLVACGPGNNGGDGLVVARHLLTQGHQVRVALFGDASRLRGDAAENFRAWRGVGGHSEPLSDDESEASRQLRGLLRGADAVVDALFGTGLSRPLDEPLARRIDELEASRVPIYALDLPSGLDADSGCVHGRAVRARATLTFGHPKRGLLTSAGADHAGEIEVVDLGVPADLGPGRDAGARWLESRDVARWLSPRALSAHKGSAGRVAIVAGSPGKTGAALLATTAALRAGAGLVTACTFPQTARALDRRVQEAMTAAIDERDPAASIGSLAEGMDAVVIGPGLGLSEAARQVVERVVLGFAGPVVIDADAITHLAGRADELRGAAGPRLLTPHPGELGRLLGVTAADVESDRFGSVERAVALVGHTVLLKGPHTLIGAPGEPIWVSSAGHPVLATGGSGDVLSGICGALSVRHRPLARAAALAAELHGWAARRWLEAHGGADRGLLAGELSEQLPAARAGLAALAASLPI